MIFCDMGVHPTSWGYSAYADITEKLIASGIPREQIAAIGDADSDAKKQALFDKVRSGSIRVLIGSTQKLGTGTNVQKRLIALHHLDAPWKPAEVEQRDGRILRQKNENEEVAIYRYVTKGSFDAYTWQALETKARFISQVMTGESGVRTAEDIGGQELSYAEVKAIASGNPAVLTLAESDAELQRLSVLKKNHADEQYVARRSLKELPATIERLSQRLADLKTDLATATAHANDRITIGNRVCPREEAMAVLTRQLNAVPEKVREAKRVPLGIYRGLRFGLVLDPQFAPTVYLEGVTKRGDTLSREHHGPRAVLNAVERLANGFAASCDSVRQDLAVAEGQRRDYQARLGKPFAHESYLTSLTALRDQLKVALSAPSGEAAKAGAPEAPELAEQIKALRAAQTIEAAPLRVGKRRLAAAEEPVTARIRRKTGAIPPSDPHIESDAVSESGDTFSPKLARNPSGKPQVTFQDRVAMKSRNAGTSHHFATIM